MTDRRIDIHRVVNRLFRFPWQIADPLVPQRCEHSLLVVDRGFNKPSVNEIVYRQLHWIDIDSQLIREGLHICHLIGAVFRPVVGQVIQHFLLQFNRVHGGSPVVGGKEVLSPSTLPAGRASTNFTESTMHRASAAESPIATGWPEETGAQESYTPVPGALPRVKLKEPVASGGGAPAGVFLSEFEDALNIAALSGVLTYLVTLWVMA